MVQIPTKSLTLEEFLQLPETKPASEYIDGKVAPKPMPQGQHSLLQRELTFFLTTCFRTSGRAQVFPELRCTFGGRSLVPDLAVFQTLRIPRESNGNVANVFEIPPDWAIEILSPNQSQTRVTRNLLHCLHHGTELGWLLDPSEACIFVYRSDTSVRVFDRSDEVLPMPEFAREIRLTTDEIWRWLQQ